MKGLILSTLILAAILALILGLIQVLTRDAGLESQKQAEELQVLRERLALDLERERALQPWKQAFLIGLMAVTLLSLASLGYGLTRLLLKRASTVYPDEHGIYPVLRGRVGDAEYTFDPNRSPAPVTVFAKDGVDSTVRVIQAVNSTAVVSDELRDIQSQVTSQAQAVQAIRAGVSGTGLDDHVHGIVRGIMSGRQELPPVKVLERLEPTHIERLLESGDEDA